MGKSSGANNVNSNLQSQYKGLNDPNNPLNSLMGQQQNYLGTQIGRGDQTFNNAMSGFSNLNPDTNNLYGQGVFSDFAKTGGFSDTDKANYRSRATSMIPSIYGGIADQLSNQSTINHGMNPGYTGQMAKLTRDQGQAAQNASMNAEGSLHDMINQGKLAGAGGLQRGAEALGQFGLGKQGLANQMYGMGQSGVNSSFSNFLSGLGLKQSEIDSIMQMQSGRSDNTPLWQKLLGPILGAGGSLLGGLAGGGKRNSSPDNSNNTSDYGPVNYSGGQY